MYIRSIKKTVSSEQTKVIQEVVILEESKLSHSVINKNKESKFSFSTQIRRANIVFPHKKTAEKGNGFITFVNPSYRSMDDCFIKHFNRFINSTKNFSSISRCLSCNGGKKLEFGRDKKNG